VKIILQIAVLAIFGCCACSPVRQSNSSTEPDYRATNAVLSYITTQAAQEKNAPQPKNFPPTDETESRKSEDARPPNSGEIDKIPFVQISPQQADDYIGQEVCVSGKITGTYNSGKAFFINYVSSKSGFYALSFDTANPPAVSVGDCVITCGMVKLYKGRSEIIVDDPGTQLYFCK